MDDKFIMYYDMYYDDVYRLVYSYTFNRSDTEDICQRCFLKLYNLLINTTYPENYIKQWLFRVAINESKNILKSFWRKNVFDIDDYDFKLSSKSVSFDIRCIVEKMPVKYRYVIYLYYYEGYSINEIAYISKKKEATIKTQLKRARDLIRKDVNGYE